MTGVKGQLKWNNKMMMQRTKRQKRFSLLILIAKCVFEQTIKETKYIYIHMYIYLNIHKHVYMYIYTLYNILF